MITYEKKRRVFVFSIIIILGLDALAGIIEGVLEELRVIDTFSIYYFFFSSCFLKILSVGFVLYFSQLLNYSWNKTLQYRFKSINWEHIILSIFITLILWIFSDFVDNILMEYLPTFGLFNYLEDITRNANSFFDVFLLILTIGVFTGISEEIFFRGYCYNILRSSNTLFSSVSWTSIIFIIFHPVPAFIPTLVLANIVLCLSYEYTKSLLVPTTMHCIYNSISVLVLLRF